MEKTALIWAEDGRGLQKVYGIGAAKRLILLARLIGFDKIFVAEHGSDLLPVLSEFTGIEGLAYIHGESWQSILGKLPFHEDEYVLLLNAGLVVDRWSLNRLLQAGRERESVLLRKGGSVKEAAFFVKASRLYSLMSVSQGWHEVCAGLAADAIHVETDRRLPLLLDPDRANIREAEAALSVAAGEATWERDSLLYRHASRHISRLISPWIARTGITANMVTLFCTLIGLAGAFVLTIGGYLSQITGSLLFLFSTIIDLVDGEVARLKLQESNFGHYFDIICDNIVHVAVFVGIAFGLYQETGNGLFLRLLWFLLGGLGICALILNRILSENRTGLQPSPSAVLLESLFNNRDFAYVMTALALFHRLDWFFVASAIGAYLLALVLWAIRFFVSRPAGHRGVAGS
ncbi:MAG TPA: CDP-alcohol phosphatidyltransferase family protein [Syntrophorhabdaceae bacterium]